MRVLGASPEVVDTQGVGEGAVPVLEKYPLRLVGEGEGAVPVLEKYPLR